MLEGVGERGCLGATGPWAGRAKEARMFQKSQKEEKGKWESTRLIFREGEVVEERMRSAVQKGRRVARAAPRHQPGQRPCGGLVSLAGHKRTITLLEAPHGPTGRK